MKTKSFDEYLAKRLDKKEIKEIEQQAELEYKALYNLQKEVSSAFSEYIYKEKIGFNEAVRRLNMSPTQVTKIQKGEANLTLASLAHIGAMFKKSPHIIFKSA
jgi:hypothetical protein